MSLLQKVKETLGVAEASERHSYECETCYARFDAVGEDPTLIVCESCGSSDVSRVTPE